MNFIDSHCHLYDKSFVNKLYETIRDCKLNNINLLLSISVDYESSLKNIEISQKFEEVFCTIGLHPNYVTNEKDTDKILCLLKKKKKIIGIGETGIDLYRSKENFIKQRKCFITQIEFAIKNKLPVIIHSRDSEKETYEILEYYKSYNLKFIIHCFSGSLDFAKKCLNLDGYISFSGILTFKNNHLVDVCKEIPLDRLLIETDSPYLAPHPYRGRTNHPKYVKIIAESLATIKNLNLKNIADITSKNFNNLFFDK